MGRRFFNDGQEIVFEDLNAISSALERQIYDRLAYFVNGKTDDAFFGDSFKVIYSSANTVIVTSGLGFQRDNTQSSPEPRVRPLYLVANTNAVIDAPNGSNDRIDIVCVKNRLSNEISGTRNFKDANSGQISQESFTIQKDWDAEILVVAGEPAGSPEAPETPSGYIKIAELAVTAVSGLSGSGAITDSRSTMPVGALATLNTVGFERLTAGASVSIETLFADIDALLKNGDFQYFDLEDLESDPAAPVPSDYHRIFMKDGSLYIRSTGGAVKRIGSGGGVGSMDWYGSGSSEPEDFILPSGVRVKAFSPENNQSIFCQITLPDDYVPGSAVKLVGGLFRASGSGTGNVLIRTRASVLKAGVDTSGALGTRTSENVQVAADGEDLAEIGEIDVSSSLGIIDGVALAANNTILVEMFRDLANETGGLDEEAFVLLSSLKVKIG